MKLNEIWYYPIKSLTGNKITQVVLNPGLGIPHDRRWALARPQGQAIGNKDWHKKSEFFVLVKDTKLSTLHCNLDDRTGLFSLQGPDSLVASGNIFSDDGALKFAKAVGLHLGLVGEQYPVLVEAAQMGYVDTLQGPISILNLASLKAFENSMGITVSPLRFRMNFLVQGAEPWVEREWLGKHIRIGKTVIQITEETGRCKATHINPDTGVLDAKILHALKKSFNHTNLGVYGKVIDGGLIQPGDEINVLD